MTPSSSLTPLTDDDYGSIEAAVMETIRGRRFLTEYARRNRAADTEVLLQAIARLERTLFGERTTLEMDRIHFDLVEMARAIVRTKAEIAAIRPEGDVQSRVEEATEELGGIVRTTERATSDILDAAEHIQEAAWMLRERGAEETFCDALDMRATDIYVACAFQDLTAQRTTKVIEVLRYLEGRINTLIAIWDEPNASKDLKPPAAPSLFRGGLSQSDVDVVIVGGEELFEPGARKTSPINGTPARPLLDDDLIFVDATPRPGGATSQSPAGRAIVRDALSAIDALDAREKLLRFT